jgi:hypothetical protein
VVEAANAPVELLLNVALRGKQLPDEVMLKLGLRPVQAVAYLDLLSRRVMRIKQQTNLSLTCIVKLKMPANMRNLRVKIQSHYFLRASKSPSRMGTSTTSIRSSDDTFLLKASNSLVVLSLVKAAASVTFPLHSTLSAINNPQ